MALGSLLPDAHPSPEVQSVVNGLLEALNYRIRSCLDVLGDIGKSPRLDAPDSSNQALEQTFVNMATEISHLNKMSNNIRRAGKETQILKALDFCIKDDDGNNVEPTLLGHFEHHVRDRFPDAREKIQKRLARMMLLRRKRILHRRQRYDSTAFSPQNEVPKVTIALPTAQATASSAKANSKQGNSQSKALALHQSAPSQIKSATTLVPDAYKEVTSSPSVISASKTVALGSHEVLCFPPAPGHNAKRKFEKLKAKYLAEIDTRLGPTDQDSHHVADKQLEDFLRTELQVIGEITCPYCLSALPAEEVFSQQKWETHVKNDLDPYVCLAENCTQPDELYSHSDAWFAHLNQHSQRWRCSLQHNLDPSTTREEYIQHLRNVHKVRLSDAQLRVLANKSARKAVKPFQLCPLCGKDEIQVGGRLEAHIVGHLRSLAIKSLPIHAKEISETDESGEESIQVSRPQSRTTVQDLEDVTLVSSGTDLTLDQLIQDSDQNAISDTNFLGVPHSELDPEHEAWSSSWSSYVGGLTVQKTFPSSKDDPILQSMLVQKEGILTILRDPKRNDSIRGYHDVSHDYMLEFEITLKNFHEHLDKHKDKAIGVQLKLPSEYSFQDVLEIATELQEDHKNVVQVKNCMGLIRKMFRRTGEKGSVLENLLSFVPSDTYGSLICGGFTMILMAARNTHGLREEIYQAISEIPRHLSHIQRQLHVHYTTPNLRACVDRILVAILILLERIIGELTLSLTKKVLGATNKGSDYANDVKDAIKTLSKSVGEFDSKARILNSESLAEVKEDGIRTRIAVDHIENLLQQTKQEKEVLHERIRFLESQAIGDKGDSNQMVSGLRQMMVQEELQIAVYNAFYGLFMAHPNFNDRTGMPNARSEHLVFKALRPTSNQNDRQPTSIDLWLQELSQPRSDSSYIDECLGNVWDLSLKEMDRVKYIMSSAELRAWLQSSRSTTLVIDSETRPDEVFNAVTSSIAIVTHTLTSEANFPVLSFFCGLHANDVYDEKSSGPIGMLTCLNSQLMEYFRKRELDTTLREQLKNPKFRRKSQNGLFKALELFESLFQDLPEDEPVVVAIDSACRLLGSRSLTNEAIGGLLQVAGRANRAVKILITSPWSADELGLNSFMQLYIPDYIDGDREGLNLELVQKDAAEAVSASKARVKNCDDSDSTFTSASDSGDG